MLTDAVAYNNSHFGVGTGPIYLEIVACSGSEGKLIDCSHTSIVSCTNDHTQDAGVRCQC